MIVDAADFMVGALQTAVDVAIMSSETQSGPDAAKSASPTSWPGNVSFQRSEQDSTSAKTVVKHESPKANVCHPATSCEHQVQPENGQQSPPPPNESLPQIKIDPSQVSPPIRIPTTPLNDLHMPLMCNATPPSPYVSDSNPSLLSLRSSVPTLRTYEPNRICNMCNREMCPHCDSAYNHTCGVYLEASRKRNGNSLRGNEYMNIFVWAWEGAKNVVVPSRFFRDLEVGTGRSWTGARARWGRRVTGWGCWGVASLLVIFWFVLWTPVLVGVWLVEDEVWKAEGEKGKGW